MLGEIAIAAGFDQCLSFADAIAWVAIFSSSQ